MEILRTPTTRFETIEGFGYEPHYALIPDGDRGELQIAYVEAGDPAGKPIVLLHGEPSWSYLYRDVIAQLEDTGARVIAPDLVGFGRSDKPSEIADHTYARHVEWMRALLFDALDLDGVTMVGQDWGGLIGLRLVADNSDRFRAMVLANTGLPTGDHRMPDVWMEFRAAVRNAETLDVGRLVQSGTVRTLTDAEVAAYDAPFPTEAFKAGPRAMPSLVPAEPDDPASQDNREAWAKLVTIDIPTLLAFSDSDPITGAMGPVFAKTLPGVSNHPQPVIENAGHFLQEDNPAALGGAIRDFLASVDDGD